MTFKKEHAERKRNLVYASIRRIPRFLPIDDVSKSVSSAPLRILRRYQPTWDNSYEPSGPSTHS